MRAVLDSNVLISALLAPAGASGQILVRWLAGDFELVVSEHLVAELERALAYPKLRKHVPAADAAAFVQLVRSAAAVAAQPEAGTHHSRDPSDDYLLSLAEAERAVLVTGDDDLLAMSGELPILPPRAFLESL